MVGDGEADLVATLRWGFEWDIAAAALIAEKPARRLPACSASRSPSTPPQAGLRSPRPAPGIHAAAVERLRERAMAIVEHF